MPSDNNCETLPIRPSSDVKLLLDRPRKWTAKHLSVANIKEMDMRVDEILNPMLLPSDNDPELKHIANLLCDPIKQERYRWNRDGMTEKEIQFGSFYLRLCHSLDFIYVVGLLNKVLWELHPDCDVIARDHTLVTIATSFLKPTETSVDGCIARCSVNENASGIPLAVFSKVTEKSHQDRLAKHIVPQLLIQANMAYNHDPNLDHYIGYVLGLSDSNITVTKTVISPDYIKSIDAGHSVSGSLPIYSYQSYDIREIGSRKEFLRLFIGLDRYCHQRPELAFPVQRLKYGPF